MILGFEEYDQGRWKVRDIRIQLTRGNYELRAMLLTDAARREEFRLLTNLWKVDAELLNKLYEAR